MDEEEADGTDWPRLAAIHRWLRLAAASLL